MQKASEKRGRTLPAGKISRRGAEGAEEFSVRVVGGVGGKLINLQVIINQTLPKGAEYKQYHENMSFLDFFRKKADGEQKNKCSIRHLVGKLRLTLKLNRLLNQMYPAVSAESRASSSSVGKSKPVRPKAEPDSNTPPIISRRCSTWKAIGCPTSFNNKAYGFEDEDFALSIPRPAPDANKARKLFEMGMADKGRMSWEGEESGWTQQCHFLFAPICPVTSLH